MVDIDKIIASNIKANYKDAKIYIERAENMSYPAFLIKTISSDFDKKLGNLYKNELLYQIVHIIGDDDGHITDYEEYKKVAFNMFDICEVMTANGVMLRGYDMSYRIADNTLQFFVTFKIRYYKDKERILMNELKVNESKKGE